MIDKKISADQLLDLAKQTHGEKQRRPKK